MRLCDIGYTAYAQQGPPGGPPGKPPKPFDRETFSRVELTHGVMATMAFAAFFPLGAIAIRTIPGRLALGVHLFLQVLGYAFFIAAFGMGIWMAHTLEPIGADFVSVLIHKIVELG
jgi:hypothetical protein